MTIKKTAGINGFGRFAFGLFRSWFNDQNSSYKVLFINDDFLTISDIAKILREDTIVTDFNDLTISILEDNLLIKRNNGNTEKIKVTNSSIDSAMWLGEPDILFECSGRKKDNTFKNLLIRNTKNIIIGSIQETVDCILVLGHNHFEYNKSIDKVISFGSCTAIPGILMISFIHSKFKIVNCTINIVHSVPKWQLDAGQWKTIKRKVCSLEKIAPKLIKSFSPNCIKVNYTYAPYIGVSSMDFEYTLSREITTLELETLLLKEIKEGRFKGLISMIDEDIGAENFLNSHYSIVIIKSSIDIRHNRVYFWGYFNNEGSGIRLHELANFIVKANNN